MEIILLQKLKKSSPNKALGPHVRVPLNNYSHVEDDRETRSISLLIFSATSPNYETQLAPDARQFPHLDPWRFQLLDLIDIQTTAKLIIHGYSSVLVNTKP